MNSPKQTSLQFGSYFNKFLPPDPNQNTRIYRSKTEKKKKEKKEIPKKQIPLDREDREIESIRNKAMNGLSLAGCDTELFPKVIEILKNQQLKAYDSNKYELYSAYDAALMRLANFYEVSQKKAFKKDIETKYVERIQNAETELQKLENGYAKERREMIENMKAKLESLKEKHEEELSNYNNEWRNEEKVKQYNKSSTKLRELYIEVEKLKAAKRFDEIKYVQAQINERTAKEMDVSEHRLFSDYNEGLNLLNQKHAYELATLQKANKDKLDTFDTKVKNELEVVKLRISKLERSTEGDGRAEIEWKRMVADGCISSRSITQSSARSWRSSNSSEYLFIPIKQVPMRPSQSRLNYRSVV